MLPAKFTRETLLRMARLIEWAAHLRISTPEESLAGVPPGRRCVPFYLQAWTAGPPAFASGPDALEHGFLIVRAARLSPSAIVPSKDESLAGRSRSNERGTRSA